MWELISSTCSPVLVFHCVSVDNTKNLRDGLSALRELSPTGRWKFLSFVDYMSSSWCITVVQSWLLCLGWNVAQCTVDGLQKCLVKDPRMIVVVRRRLVKLSVCCSNTVVPAEYLFLGLKLVRLQLYERRFLLT